MVKYHFHIFLVSDFTQKSIYFMLWRDLLKKK